jgi:hypothetical protein
MARDGLQQIRSMLSSKRKAPMGGLGYKYSFY